ncbi:MAG: DUF6537 domain-containing protein, partial [Pseudomonadota bacterium]
IGRWAVLYPEEAAQLLTPNVVQLPKSEKEQIDFRADHLVAYQSKRLSKRFRKLVERAPEGLRLSVAKGYHKLLAYKDEYEVARLLLSTRQKAEAEFEGDFKMTFNLAPPLLSREGPNGRPMKRQFGAWMLRPMGLLRRMKVLRGTPLDLFGYTQERKRERALIKQFEADMAEVVPLDSPAT